MSRAMKVTKETPVETVIRGWVQRAAITGQADPYVGKRQQPRTTWTVPVVMRIVDAAGERLLHLMSRDVSLTGLGLTCREKLSPMTTVQLWVGAEEQCVVGRVMHCTQGLSGYVIGIEFDRAAACNARRAG
jgi:hypothetical protein